MKSIKKVKIISRVSESNFIVLKVAIFPSPKIILVSTWLKIIKIVNDKLKELEKQKITNEEEINLIKYCLTIGIKTKYCLRHWQ